MTVVLTINVAGRPKRDLIEMMREFCGQSGFDFELTAEEVASDLRLLDTMMADDGLPPAKSKYLQMAGEDPGDGLAGR